MEDYKFISYYLPRQPKCFYTGPENHLMNRNQEYTLIKARFDGGGYLPTYWLEGDDDEAIGFQPDYFKIMLHPKECITTEVTTSGETFVPIERIVAEFYNVPLRELTWEWRGNYLRLIWEHAPGMYDVFEVLDFQSFTLPFNVSQKLIEWGVDIFGLIDKDIAVPFPG